ncbi:tRNA dimethylallyltransferase 2 isoform X1 [Cinnamomum micranthum f. kanehirae]|uniref:tRNA dimethylallyltransferase 2 isoform X1 n=1 Tax=Cinnamomum micranthum f. kanehirae TaxID=337451 RepID=A0A3S3MU98_9MAGN|nr:tRNA dimethylallyltransferase 2 isoform X1 [Cinnamomum micranthum f. kanehirae]
MGEHLSVSDSNPSTSVEEKTKPKLVVIMGATGSGKSRLSIDISSFFPIEIINADSMQVYQGLDVLTNKVPIEDQKGVPHHLLGSVSANVDFTAKDFRDQAIPIIDDILSRNSLPVIVGGTNYYIQALVSAFLLDDLRDNDECDQNSHLGDPDPNSTFDWDDVDLCSGFDHLKEVDPAAANRIHPNNRRKVAHYLNLYASTGVPPSKLFQGKASEKWGRVDNFRYNCCFLWVDASLCALDRYVDKRVDSMIDAGLLNEVYNIYNPNADYTRGLKQAIGVREFEEFLGCYLSNPETCYSCNNRNDYESSTKTGLPPTDTSIDRLKANTRRLVRRQKRRLNRLRTFFGWDLHYIDATEAFLSNSGDSWTTRVVKPCVNIIEAFIHENKSSLRDSKMLDSADAQSVERDLWTQYVCEACGNRILRGAHEWEEHKLGRRHRKRVLRLRKSQMIPLVDQ